jgi:hypothetical protein
MIEEYINLGKWTERDLDRILSESSHMHDVGERIEFLSRQLLNVPYAESTLTGSVTTPEVFVINLEGVDCLTFIEYVEALRVSASFSAFKDNLKRVRYKSGEVAFEKRNHFFTDWIAYNAHLIDDITEEIAAGKTVLSQKLLNEREGKTSFVQGITPVMREIRYIPSEHIDETVLHRLGTGDYIGIYSRLKGLDVSHTGIFIKDGERALFRHASSSEKKRKVTDDDFMKYITDKPGIVVLRPKTYTSEVKVNIYV